MLTGSTMALFSPLCVASGRVPRAVTWLAAAGFEVPYIRSLGLKPRDVMSLWEHLIPRISRRRVDVVTEALTAGPSALVALRRAPGAVTAAEHLSKIKGSADPSRRQEQSLRSHLGAPNLLTSLVHTPDSPEDLLRELHVLLPHRDDQAEFWLALRDAAGLDENSLPSFVSGADPRPAVSAFVVGLRIQARLLDGLAGGATPTAAREIGLLTAEVLSDLEAAESGRCLPPRAGARQDRLRRLVPDSDAIPDRHACLAFAQLESVVRGDPFDLDALTTAIEGSGAALHIWERIVLLSESVVPSPSTHVAAEVSHR
jgi:hypothetical protein